MIDPRAYAALLCDWCLEVAPDQQILVQTTTRAEPAALALHDAILERGAWPHLRLAVAGQQAGFYRHVTAAQLDGHAPLALLEAETVDASVRIEAPANTRELTGVDPALMARHARALQPVRRAASSRRWALSIWPTAALAQEAGMSERDYEEFVTRALFLDRPDPIAAWRELRERQQRLVERLAPASTIRIESERTDLTLSVEGRTWRNSDGRRNMPSGEVFTSPLEDSASGTIHFDVPFSARGVEVRGVQLELRDGLVTAARAERGDEYLQAQLDTDAGARRLGEIGIGTNFGIDRATGSTLLDEKIGGTVHLALGRSYPECGGLNESAIHWDLVCDLRKGGRVTVDGETLSENGQLAVFA